MSQRSDAPSQIQMQQNYLTMDKHDLEKLGFGGGRLNLCLFLSSKCYDLSQVVLIIIYCVLLAITFLVEDFLYADTTPITSNGESCAGVVVVPPTD